MNLYLILCATLVKLSEATPCLFPGSPKNGFVSEYNSEFLNGSVVVFACSPGYMIVGPSKITCNDGKWSHIRGFCVRDVAHDKPILRKSSEDLSVKVAVDGDLSTCTPSANFWAVYLLEESEILSLKVYFKAGLSTHLTITIGDSSPSHEESDHKICFDNVVDFKDEAYFIECLKPLHGRYVVLKVENSASLCHLEVHSHSGLSSELSCPRSHGGSDTRESFMNDCYEFSANTTSDFRSSGEACILRGGHMVDISDSQILDYIRWKSVNSRRSFWVTNSWNVSLGIQNACSVVDANGLREENCESQRISRVCRFLPKTCGRPELPAGLKKWNEFGEMQINSTIADFQCDKGLRPITSGSINCGTSGLLNGFVQCKTSKCSDTPIVANSDVFPLPNTTFRFDCRLGFVLEGSSDVSCNETAGWSPTPSCVPIIDFLAQKTVQPLHIRIAVVLLLVMAAVMFAFLAVILRKRKNRQTYKVGRSDETNTSSTKTSSSGSFDLSISTSYGDLPHVQIFPPTPNKTKDGSAVEQMTVVRISERSPKPCST